MQEVQLNGESLDIVSENVSKLKELFPEILTEDKIDFDKLKEVLGNYIEDSPERYNFSWKGKSEALRLAQTPSTGTLRPFKEESKNWDTTENLYIEGDNLEILKLLQKPYYAKVKMIYIDPPYNTGNDFVYQDDYKDNLQNYLEITGQVEDGAKISTNTETSGRYHTSWINMIYPRLRLARNLLSHDGVIFISINDKELDNLRKICNEIYGEENFIACFYVKVRHEDRILTGDKDIQETIEHILAYKRGNFKVNKIPLAEKLEEYKFYINEKTKNPHSIKIGSKNAYIFNENEYDIIKSEEPNPELLKRISIRGTIKKGNSSGRLFVANIEDKFEKQTLIKVEGMGDDGLGYRYFHIPINTKNGVYFQGKPLTRTIKEKPYPNFYDFVNEFNTVGNEGEIEFKNGKKPLALIEKLFEISNINNISNCVILDFFSGSASTAHAVMKLNSQFGGNRKFIMAQLPEKIDENSDYFRAGFKNICEIGKERIRRAGENLLSERNQNGQTSLDSKSNHNLDIGFKVFKLDSSNLSKWDPEYDNLEQTLLNSVENLVPGRNELDLVYEIMIKYGIDLTLPIEEYPIKDKKFYSIGFGALIICLDDNLTYDLASEIIKLKDELSPEVMRVVFKDNGFASDSDKTNIKETLKTNGIEEFVTI
jgi:adenine-specific DNA-methyltransferase